MPSLLVRLAYSHLSRVKRKRADRIMRRIAEEHEGVDPFKKQVIVAIKNAEAFAVGWNRERIREMRRRLEEEIWT